MEMSNVFGARLQISALAAGPGMGIELLDYVSPSATRPYPPDSHANDLWHWITTLRVKDVDKAAEQLQKAGVPFISSGVITLPDDSLGFRRGFMVRDPDGHAIRIVE